MLELDAGDRVEQPAVLLPEHVVARVRVEFLEDLARELALHQALRGVGRARAARDHALEVAPHVQRQVVVEQAVAPGAHTPTVLARVEKRYRRASGIAARW